MVTIAYVVGTRVASASMRSRERLHGGQLERRRDIDRLPDRAVHRAIWHVVLERSLNSVSIGIEREPIPDVDPLNDEHAVLNLDLADRLARQASLACLPLARLQRASEGPGQSAAGGGDHEVERRRALDIAATRHPVVVGDLVVDAELDRLPTGGEVRTSERTADPLDPDAGAVDHFRHGDRF